MHNLPDYYAILHVSADAPQALIKASYRTLMQTLNAHPDRGGDPQQAVLINEAYRVLSNAAARADYDKQRIASQFTAPKSAEPDVQKNSTQTPALSCSFCQTPHHFDPLQNPHAVCSACHSPLFSSKETGDSSEQRGAIRVHKYEHITFYLCWPGNGYGGKLMDASPQGCRFESNVEPSFDQLIKIDSDIFQAVANVRSCQLADSNSVYRYAVGVSFTNVIFHMQRGNFISVSI